MPALEAVVLVDNANDASRDDSSDLSHSDRELPVGELDLVLFIYRKFNISFLRDFGNESATVNPTCDKPRGFGHPRFSFAPREGRLLDSGAGESRSRGGKSLGDEGSETAGQAGARSESVDISETEGATATPRPAS